MSGSLAPGAEPPVKKRPLGGLSSAPARFWTRKSTVIAARALVGILTHLVLRFGRHATAGVNRIPLLLTLGSGGLPMLYDLFRKLLKRDFGSDLLGGISIVTSVLLSQYLAGSIIVLMLAGGEALESYALRNASPVLAKPAKRVPSLAHRKRESEITDIALFDVAVGDTLVIYPHGICPVDGVVIAARGVMDDSYLRRAVPRIASTLLCAAVPFLDRSLSIGIYSASFACGLQNAMLSNIAAP